MNGTAVRVGATIASLFLGVTALMLLSQMATSDVLEQRTLVSVALPTWMTGTGLAVWWRRGRIVVSRRAACVLTNLPLTGATFVLGSYLSSSSLAVSPNTASILVGLTTGVFGPVAAWRLALRVLNAPPQSARPSYAQSATNALPVVTPHVAFAQLEVVGFRFVILSWIIAGLILGMGIFYHARGSYIKQEVEPLQEKASGWCDVPGGVDIFQEMDRASLVDSIAKGKATNAELIAFDQRLARQRAEHNLKEDECKKNSSPPDWGQIAALEGEHSRLSDDAGKAYLWASILSLGSTLAYYVTRWLLTGRRGPLWPLRRSR